MSEQQSIDELRLKCMNFARDIDATFSERGEIGFCRPCVGISSGGNYLAYSPSVDGGNHEPLRDLWDQAIEPDAEKIPNHYHKGDYMAVLVHGEDYDSAIRELSLWIDQIEAAGGGIIVHYATGASGVQIIFSGLSASAIVTKPFFEKLKTRIDELHPAISREQFEEKS